VGLGGDIGEGSVAVIVVKDVRSSLETVGGTVGRVSSVFAEGGSFEIVIQVVHDE
jgi:hypothetical protein